MLADLLKTYLASTFSYYLKSHMFHWNVEGPDFGELHSFLSDIYEDAFDAVDPIAEYIRILGHYTPGSLSRYAELSVIQDQIKIPRAELMFVESLQDCETLSKLAVAIFDEATSSLDTESEQAIQKNLQAILKDRTAIIIAHRLSTVRSADTIIVLDNGEIVEQGSHETMMNQRGLYHYLNHQQLNL